MLDCDAAVSCDMSNYNSPRDVLFSTCVGYSGTIWTCSDHDCASFNEKHTPAPLLPNTVTHTHA